MEQLLLVETSHSGAGVTSSLRPGPGPGGDGLVGEGLQGRGLPHGLVGVAHAADPRPDGLQHGEGRQVGAWQQGSDPGQYCVMLPADWAWDPSPENKLFLSE